MIKHNYNFNNNTIIDYMEADTNFIKKNIAITEERKAIKKKQEALKLEALYQGIEL